MMLQVFLNILYTGNFVDIVTYNHYNDSTLQKFSYQFLGDRFLQVPPENDFLSDHFLRLYHLEQRSPVWAGPGRRFNKSLWTLAVSSLKPENSPNNLISLCKQNKFNYTTLISNHYIPLFHFVIFMYCFTDEQVNEIFLSILLKLLMMILAHLGQIVFLKNLLQLFFFICFHKKIYP